MPYKLSATLLAHSSDVRAVDSPSNNLILSVSRDTTAISWNRPTPSSPFAPSAVFKAGTRYVNSVAFIQPSEDAPLGQIVTGGQDTVINVFSLGSKDTENPDLSLLGHTGNVCALSTTQAGNTIISGSWDWTAKVWKDYQLAFDLTGHQQSVLAVLALEDDTYLTGSADKTIKLWKQHKNVSTLKGHTDVVRGLALVPEIGFASCANDSEIRVWTFGGDTVYTLSGHTSFVYSLSVLPNGDVVSGGEDRTVRVWHDGECVQTIVHPAISVWSVSSMPNGDIVSGASDGVVRVFSASKDRWANDSDLKEYDEAVAGQAIPSAQVGDIKKSDLPGPDVLSVSGKKPGEVKMVKVGDLVEAHQWDSATSSWQKIGDVVDAVGQGRKQLYEGKEYDYVFDVDISEGAPPLKLPYNVTENPYAAAQRFLERNDLPLAHLDTVVQFIEKNTAGVNIGSGGNDYVDPYTGASRYQAVASAPAPGPSSGDPYTSANQYSGASQSPAQVKSKAPAIIPMTKYLHFKQAAVPAMRGKIYQFDDALRQEISAYPLAMHPTEVASLEEIFAYLSLAIAAPPPPPSTLTSAHLETIIQILDRWPEPQRFPVIDLCRLMAAFCPNICTAPGFRERFIEALFKASDWTSSWSTPLPKHRETHVLLVLRTVANMFQEGAPITDGLWVNQILEALIELPYPSLTKAQRVAFATVLLNLSCATLHVPLEPSVQSIHLALILTVIQSEKGDSEAVYRAAVALGNVAHLSKSFGRGREDRLFIQARPLISALPSTFPEDRIRNVSAEIAVLL